MKVALHVGQLLQPVPGGIGRYVEALMSALPEAGVELTTFAAGEPVPRRGQQWPAYVDLGRPYGRWRYELWHRLRRPAVELPVEVIHAPSLAVPPAGATPFVVTVHDVAFLRHPEAFTRRGLAFHRRGLAIAYHEAATVITSSRFARDELVRCGFEAERVHIASHGVEPGTAESEAVMATRLQRVGVQTPYLLCVGTIEPRKGLDTLAGAFTEVRAACPGLSLVVVGPRGWLAVPGLDAPGIRELGRVDDATLDALYWNATLCAVPSRYEGFGLPALEAMARGCPVVASDATSLPEVVGDAGRLVASGDVHAWAEVLTDLVRDASARAELATRGRSRAQRFTWAASARAHVAAYTAATRAGVRS